MVLPAIFAASIVASMFLPPGVEASNRKYQPQQLQVFAGCVVNPTLTDPSGLTFTSLSWTPPAHSACDELVDKRIEQTKSAFLM